MDGLVKGLVWVGTRTQRYQEMVTFYRDTLGLPLELEESVGAHRGGLVPLSRPGR
jgi:hypothetical protein